MKYKEMLRSFFTSDNFRLVMASKSILMVGAGGLGCELAKFFSKYGIGRLDIVDLDIIEISNLNRQFYFKKKHVKQDKALVLSQILKKNLQKIKSKLFLICD